MHAATLLSCLILSACGGGGGDDAPPAPPPPTALPDNVTVSAPAMLDTSVPTAFKQSIAAPGSGLKFAWTFGDGATSTEAAPTYTYPKAGDYDVTLKVTNEAGSTREAKYRVSVNSTARLKGLVCSGPSESGWCWENPRPTGSDRRDVFFLDAKTGWMVGANGEIFKTADAGVSWVRQTSGVSSSLTAIRFVDAQTGWAMGEFGAFLRTVDGGTTWQLSRLPSEQNYFNPTLQVISADKLLVADSSTGYSSIDGGKTWSRLSMPPSAVSPQGVVWTYTYDGLFKSTDLGVTTTRVVPSTTGYNADLKVVSDTTVVLGRWNQTYDYTNNKWTYEYTLTRTKDGGITWEVITPQGLPSDAPPRFVHASDRGMMVLVNYAPYRSVDGGSTWAPAAKPYSTDAYLDQNSFQSIDANTLAVVRGYNGQQIAFTEDLGATWISMKLPDATSYYGNLSILKSNGGAWLARQDNSYYLSADKGQTWAFAAGSTNRQSNESFRASWFFDSKRGLVLTSQGELKETTDGGLTWTVKLNELANGYTGQARLQFVSAKIGWLSTGDGRLYRSADGGATWNSGPGTTLFSDFQFIDENVGWARRYPSNEMIQTKDGGQTWTKTGAAPASASAFSARDASKALVSGYGGQILQTTDGGNTWVSRFSSIGEQVLQFQYVGDKLVWALSSNAILRSLDGGDSWTVVRPSGQSAGWRAMSFVDADHGWVVGGNGAILATQDGGKTWIQQSAGTFRSLTGVQFIDAKTGWILGDQGTILATGTGGS